jgi:hypothetical protein
MRERKREGEKRETEREGEACFLVDGRVDV